MSASRRPSPEILIRGIISDLIVDIRFTRRQIATGIRAEENAEYLVYMIVQLRKALAMRHAPKLNSWGWMI